MLFYGDKAIKIKSAVDWLMFHLQHNQTWIWQFELRA